MEISVVMSVYNAEKYIKQSIDSILNQTFKDFEFIIVNDCSNDRTLKILQEYSKKDKRIKIINNEQNLGLTKSLNKALSYAKGKYIARMDADDISHKDRFIKQYQFLQGNIDIAVLGTCGYNIDEAGRIIGERTVPLNLDEIKKTIPLVNPIIHPSTMLRRSLIEKIGYYNNNYKVVQDYDLWFRCLGAGYHLSNLPDKLLYYRVNDKYFERKSKEYRFTDFKIRYEGYKRINLPIYKRYGLFIPIFLAIVPESILKRSYDFLKKFDPR